MGKGDLFAVAGEMPTLEQRIAQGGPVGAVILVLLIEDLLVTARHGGGDSVKQKQRDSSNKAENRRHESDRNTTSHQLRIAGTEVGDGGKGDDHTDNRTEKAEKRCNGGKNLNHVVEAFDLRRLAEDLLVEFELKRLKVLMLVLLIGLEDAGEPM